MKPQIDAKRFETKEAAEVYADEHDLAAWPLSGSRGWILVFYTHTGIAAVSEDGKTGVVLPEW